MPSRMILLTTNQAAERLFTNRHGLAKYIAEGRIEPAHQLPGSKGAYLYDPEDVDRLAEELAAEAEAYAAALRAEQAS